MDKFLNKEGVKQLWNAVKQLQNVELNVELDCDHEYEITGQTGHEYGVAIPETTQMKFVKIQGQTRRYSENRYKPKNKTLVSSNAIVEYSNDDLTETLSKGSSTNESYCNASLVYLTAGIHTFGGFISNNNGYMQIINEKNTQVLSDRITWNNGKPSSGLFTLSEAQAVYVRIGLIDNNAGTSCSFSNIFIYEKLYQPNEVPLYKPYDNTLVNAKANFKSTGINLLDINAILKNRNARGVPTEKINEYTLTTDSKNVDSRTYKYSECDYFLTLPKGTYKIVCQYSSTEQVPEYYAIFLDEFGNQFAQITPTSTSVQSNTFTLNKTTKIGFMFKMSQYTQVSLSLYYETNESTFEPYNSAETAYNVELGEYDYQDMNNHIHKRTSNIITLDGSSDENYTLEPQTNGAIRYRLNDKFNDYDDSASNQFVSNSTLPNYQWVDVTEMCFGIYISKNFYFCVPAGSPINSLELFREYLQQNPIQLVYKKATETLITHVAPPGYEVHNGGLQEQVIDGKYLPYILTKKYAISVPSQIALNIEMDQQQQEQLDALKQQHDQFEQTTNDSITTIDETLTDLESRVSTAEDYLDQIPTTYATITYVDDEISKLDTSLREYVRTQFGTTEGITSFKRSQIVEANSSFTLAYGEKCVIVGIAPEDYKVSIEIASRQYSVYPYEVISNFSQYTDVKTGTGISTDYEYGPTYKMYVGSTSVNEFVSLGRKTGIGRTYTNYNVQLTVNVKCIVYFYRLS